jgi:hypothetical protein
MYDIMVASCIVAISRYAAPFEPILLSLALGIVVRILGGAVRIAGSSSNMLQHVYLFSRSRSPRGGAV